LHFLFWEKIRVGNNSKIKIFIGVFFFDGLFKISANVLALGEVGD